MPRARGGGNRSRPVAVHLGNTPEQDQLLDFVKSLNLSPQRNANTAVNSPNQAGSSRQVVLPDVLPVENSPPVVANSPRNAPSLDAPAAPGAVAATPAAQRRPGRRRGARGGAARPTPSAPINDDEWWGSAAPASPIIEPPGNDWSNEWAEPAVVQESQEDEWNYDWASEVRAWGVDTDGWGASQPDYPTPTDLYDGPPGLQHFGGPPPGLGNENIGDPPGIARSSRRNRRRRRRGASSNQAVALAPGAAAAIEIGSLAWIYGYEPEDGSRFGWDDYPIRYDDDDDVDEAPEGPRAQLDAIERELRFLSELAADDSVVMDGLREHINDLEFERDLARHDLWAARHVLEETREEDEAKTERLRIAHEANNQPEVLALRYSRACGICISVNPRVRVALVECGHLLCEPCVERLDTVGPREVNCPFCRTDSKYIRIFEELDEAADDAAPAVASNENEERPQASTASS